MASHRLLRRIVALILALSFPRLGGAKPASPASARSGVVPSFKVMDNVAAALALEAAGRSIMHLEIGQPQSGAPKPVLAAAHAALDADRLGYTAAPGIDPLRAAIAALYSTKYGLPPGAIDPARVVLTTGSSAGFLLAFTACFDVGDAVAVPSTCYPCYRNILRALGCEPVSVPLDGAYKCAAPALRELAAARAAAGAPPLKGLILSSPSNPTGARLDAAETEALVAACRELSITYISDEIYHGLTYDGEPEVTALQYEQRGDDDAPSVLVISSFSKYHSMTGWRLGWMVLPPNLVDAVNRLHQNMYINAPTLSQRAALALFGGECDDELEAHRARYERNRAVVLASLAELGLLDVAPADGAFYVYVDVGAAAAAALGGSENICARLLEEAGVATAPGTDFEDSEGGLGAQRLRLSYCGGQEDVKEGMVRLQKWWRENAPGAAS